MHAITHCGCSYIFTGPWSTARAPVPPLRDGAPSWLHQADGPVRDSDRGRWDLVPDPVPDDLLAVGSVPAGTSQLRGHGLPDDGRDRAAVLRLTGSARARSRAGGTPPGNRGSTDRAVPVRRTDAYEPRRCVARRGVQDRGRRAARNVLLRAVVLRPRPRDRRSAAPRARSEAGRHRAHHPGPAVAQLAAADEHPDPVLQP